MKDKERSDAQYLQDILGCCEKILGYTSKIVSSEDFENNDLVYDATLKNLIIIGEASNRISQEFRNNHPQFNWKGMKGMRNILIHAYNNVDTEFAWKTIIFQIPKLKLEIESIVSNGQA